MKRSQFLLTIIVVTAAYRGHTAESARVFHGATTPYGVVGQDFSYQAEASSYRLTPDRADWTTAESNAVAQGGHLVTINSDREQDALERKFLTFSNSGTPYWIGLNDVDTPDSFVWSSAEPVTYTKWKSGEPNNYSGDEKYVVMNWERARSASFPKGTWNDAPLNGTTGFGGVSDGPYRGIMELPLPADARFFATNLPTPLVIDPLTGLITGTPCFLGTFNVTLSLVSLSGTITQQVIFSFVRGPDDSHCSNCPPVFVPQPFNRTNFVGDSVTIDGTASGTAPLVYQWRKDTANIPGVTNATLMLTNVHPSDAGSYVVRVGNAFGAMTSSVQRLTVVIPPCTNCPPVRYVNVDSANPTLPYTNWATAATSIQDAIDSASGGDEIIVTNGVYAVGVRAVDGVPTANRVAVLKPLTVRSVNGSGATLIDGGGAVRCAYVSDGATLTGFTLTNGNAVTVFGANEGGGVWCAAATALISNCVLIGNSANYGGGAYGGTMNNCFLLENHARWDGSGGGAMRCTLNNSVLRNNSAEYFGGGAADCTLNNCVVMGNWASARDWEDDALGGGAAFSTLNNCTITGNSADGGGGVLNGALNNCIVYYNWGGNYNPDWLRLGPVILNYCATAPLPTNGTGNITNEPVFVDFECGNLRLAWNSPGINAGDNAYATGNFDLDGHPRIVGSTVDIGAYEFQTVPPRLGLERDGSGGFFTRCNGITGFTYQLQRATSVTGPWTNIVTATARASGVIEFHDTNAPPGSAFYRTATSP